MGSREVYAIFVAGGSGTRMGGAVPKQFLDLCGLPVLQRSIERFLEAEPTAHVIVVLPAQHILTWREMCVEHAVSFAQTVVKGGMTRFHSVQAALEKVPDGVIAAVHDGVRPLVSPSMIRGMLDLMAPGNETAPSVISADTTVRHTRPDRVSLSTGASSSVISADTTVRHTRPDRVSLSTGASSSVISADTTVRHTRPDRVSLSTGAASSVNSTGAASSVNSIGAASSVNSIGTASSVISTGAKRSGEISSRVIRALIPALPVTDTLRCLDPGSTLPPRSSLVAVQTPQIFLSEDLKRAYSQPYDTSFTDDASVVERLGIPIEIFPGDKNNIKITTPEDLTLARLFLQTHYV